MGSKKNHESLRNPIIKWFLLTKFIEHKDLFCDIKGEIPTH